MEKRVSDLSGEVDSAGDDGSVSDRSRGESGGDEKTVKTVVMEQGSSRWSWWWW